MCVMPRLRKDRTFWSALIAFGVALSLAQGCGRSVPLHRTDTSSPSGDQKLPFHPETDHASAGDGAHPAVSPDPKPTGGLPFRAASHPRILPSGTLFAVQLKGSLSTASSHAGDAFAGSVAAPLTIDGDTLVGLGAEVTGRVESVESPEDRPGRSPGSGYFRLTLSEITLDGRQLALQTSSLFARGTSTWQSNGIQVQKGRRLIFRLTAPVTLDPPNSLADRQTSDPTPE